jgi:YidC/Oxa1 family membrane protein insertase
VDRNLLLAFALSFAVLSLWMMWQGQYTRPEAGQVATHDLDADQQAQPAAPIPQSLPPAPELPRRAERSEVADAVREEGTVLHFETALYTAELNSRGAGIQYWGLREYQTGPQDDRQPVLLTMSEAPLDLVLATPFPELGLGDLAGAVFDVLEADDDTVVFQLSRDGITLTKTFEFERESYAFRVRVEVENGSEQLIAPLFAIELPAQVMPQADFRELALAALHQGSVEQQMVQGLGKAGFFGSLSGKEPEQVHAYAGDTDWAGVQTTYFLSVVLPDEPAEASARFVATEPGKAGVVQVFFDPVELQPGQSATRELRGYMGPKEMDRLVALGGGAVHSINLGWSWIAPMTRFFGWLLRALYSLPLLGNYGVAIVILTILVRVVTAPLVTKQMRSMEGMRGLQPKIKELQEKYKDDRQKQSEETMRLYRKEGVNPLGGCLPMLLQLPVMIGLFYALRCSIELREAPFFGWIDDLSAPETLFTIPGLELPVRVLPLIMGGTMILQQKMTPQPTMDATQARMMTTVMPVVMTVVFYQFASGLVLYWMLSNILAIAHQMWIRRAGQKAGASRKAARKRAKSSS